MTPRIGIDSHEQVVLIHAHLHDGVEIPTLEVRLEKELFVEVDGGVHTAEESGTLL